MYGAKVIAFAVWRLRELMAEPNDSSADWRVVGLLTAVAVQVLFSLMVALSYVFGCRLYSKGILLGVGFVVIGTALLGFPTSAHLDSLVKKYRVEFDTYAETIRWVGTALIVVAIVGAIFLTVKMVDLARQLPNELCVRL